jgi:hypothetical protein
LIRTIHKPKQAFAAGTLDVPENEKPLFILENAFSA